MKKVLLSLLLAVFAIPFAAQAQQNFQFQVNVDTVVSCGAYVWELGDGHTYDNDTVVTYQNGDTVRLLVLSISPSYVNEPVRVNAGCSYTWNNHVYDSVGTYVDTLKTVDQCDSIVTLVIESLSRIDVNTIDTIACGRFVWGDDTIYASQVVSDTVETSDNCLTVTNMNLTVRNYQEFFEIDTVCELKVWHNDTLTVSNEYTMTVNGTPHSYFNGTDSATYKCDSVYTLNLYVYPVETEGHVMDTIISKCESVTFIPFGERSRRFVANESIDTMFVKEYRNPGRCMDSIIDASFIIRSGSTAIYLDTVVCDSYTWPLNEVTYTNGGTYEYRLADTTNVQGCDSTMILKLKVNASPVISAINGDLEVVPGSSTTLSADVNQTVTYKWTYGSQSASTPEITLNNVNENVDVTLVVTNNKQCSDTGWVTVMPFVSIEDVQADNISLYPNPTVAIVNIECAEAIEHVSVFNTVGQEVIRQSQLGSKTALDFSVLSQGSYTLRVVLASGEVIVRKVVVSR